MVALYNWMEKSFLSFQIFCFLCLLGVGASYVEKALKEQVTFSRALCTWRDE